MTDPNLPTHIDTVLQHSGLAPFDPDTGAAPVAMPAVRTSTVRFASLDALDRAMAARARGERVVTYGRGGMDTHAALEGVFCELEGAQRCFLASSGQGAITLALLSVLKSGDHVLMADCVYGPVRMLDRTMFTRLNIQTSYCRARPEELARQVRDNTRVLYVESPGSLLYEVLDMPALAAFAAQHELILMTDNTWGSGYAYRPLELGADMSIIAGTKYVGGHSDLMLGAVAVRDPALIAALTDTHYAMGCSLSADDAWLALRGVRTMPIRMREQGAHALRVAGFLASRPEVLRVYHPALPSDPGHALWQRDCQGSNGMLSVALDLDTAAARRFVDALTLFGIGFSWGGFESLVQLVEPSVLAPHSYWTYPGKPLVRLHIGLESPEDLISDLERALARARS